MATIDPPRMAVIAVHFQNDIVGPDGAFAPFFRAEIERVGVLHTTARLLDAARTAGVKVFYLRVAFQPGYPDLVANSPLLGMVAQQNCLVDGTPGAAIADEVAPRAGDVVVTHQRVSGFPGSELDALLRGAGIDTLAFAGVATNAAVEGTARTASDLGYRTIVVSDACSAGSPAAHQASLDSLGLLAEITTSEELLAMLTPRPADRGDARATDGTPVRRAGVTEQGGTMTARPFTSVWSDLNQVEFSQGFIQAGPYRTRYLQAGDKSKPTLIMLHGITGHAEAYVRNLGSHAEHFSCWAIDFIGHGYSSKPRHPLEIKHYIDQLLQFMAAIGVEKASFTGESLGGWVTAQFAVDHPEKVERIVLNTMGGTMANPQVMERLYTLSIEAAEDPSWERVKARLEWLMADPSMVTDDLIKTRQMIFQQSDWLEACKANMALQDPETRRRNMLTDDTLGKIQAPALVLWTTKDPSGPVTEAERIAKLIPNARLAVMENCGHWPQYEDTETFNRIHLDFLLDR